jgi:hypothetical protein
MSHAHEFTMLKKRSKCVQNWKATISVQLSSLEFQKPLMFLMSAAAGHRLYSIQCAVPESLDCGTILGDCMARSANHSRSSFLQIALLWFAHSRIKTVLLFRISPNARIRHANLSVFFDSLSSEHDHWSPETVCYLPTVVRSTQCGGVIISFLVVPHDQVW